MEISGRKFPQSPVNFINVLCTSFLYKILAPKITKPNLTKEKLSKKIYIQKGACKMLMKLTNGTFVCLYNKTCFVFLMMNVHKSRHKYIFPVLEIFIFVGTKRFNFILGQFYQHFTCTFFIQKCLFCQNVTREKLRKALSNKKARVKC